MNVIGENIKKNRLKNNLSTRDLASKVGVSHTAVNKFEKGILEPNKQMIRKMARILKVKTQKLILDTSTQIIINDIEFRDENKITQKNRELVNYIVKEKLEKYSELIDHFPENRFSFFNVKKYKKLIDSYEDIENKAREIRESLGVGQKVSFNILELMENNGIIVLFINEVEGFISQEGYLQDKYLYIAISDIKELEKQRYNLANELIRVILEIKDKELDREELLDRVTLSFLMDEELLRLDIGRKRKRLSRYELKRLNMKYKLPYVKILKRLLLLNIITEGESQRLTKYAKGKDLNLEEKQEETDIYKRLVIEALMEKYIDIKNGRKYLGFLGEEFLLELSEDRGGK